MDNKIFVRIDIRSSLNFLVLTIIASAFTIFILVKAEEAINEIQKLSENRISLLKEAGVADELSVPYTSAWKTYRNEQYGFEVRYPASFTAFIDVKEVPRMGFEVTPPSQDSKKIYLSERPAHFLCCEPTYVQIEVLDELVTDFEVWLKDRKFMPPENDFRLKRKGYETFAGERAYYIFSEAGLDSYGSSILVNREGKSFLVRYNGDTATFINIVNSFKFIK